ncbi:MAG: hypothetical protein R3292_11540 [Alcanivorax sp.]|nr:hypothetical protein [Alcanivorax sp.]
MPKHTKIAILLTGLSALGLSTAAQAEVDRLYSPRISAHALSAEFRSTYVDDSNSPRDDQRQDKLAIHYAFNSRVALGAYLGAMKMPGRAYRRESNALQGRMNIFQNRQHALGVQAQVSKARNDDIWELKVGSLYEQTLGNKVRLQANAFISQVHGSDALNTNTAYSGALQLAYTHSKCLQPAIEYYGSRNDHGVGPVLLGSAAVAGHPLRWQAGVILGVTDNATDTTLRAQLTLPL